MKKDLAIKNCYFGTLDDDGTILVDQTGDCNDGALFEIQDLMAEVKSRVGRCVVMIDLKPTAGFSARRSLGDGKPVVADAIAFVGGAPELRTAITVSHRAMTLKGQSWKLGMFKTREEATAWLASVK